MLSAIDQTGHFIIPLYGRSCARGWKWNSAIEFVHLPFHPRLARLRDLSTLDRKAWIQLRLIPRGDSKIRIDIEKLGPFVTSSWYRLLLSTNRFVSIRKRQASPSFSSSSSSSKRVSTSFCSYSNVYRFSIDRGRTWFDSFGMFYRWLLVVEMVEFWLIFLGEGIESRSG